MTKERAAGGLWNQRIENDISRDQPKINNGVKGPGKEGPSQPHIDGINPTKRPRYQLKDHLKGDTDTGPKPKNGIGRRRKHRQRNGCTGMSFLPLAKHDHHDDGPKPGADHQESRTQIEKDAGLNRWIKGVENRGLTQ